MDNNMIARSPPIARVAMFPNVTKPHYEPKSQDSFRRDRHPAERYRSTNPGANTNPNPELTGSGQSLGSLDAYYERADPYHGSNPEFSAAPDPEYLAGLSDPPKRLSDMGVTGPLPLKWTGDTPVRGILSVLLLWWW